MAQSEPKMKIFFLNFASLKEGGFTAGVNDEVFANLQQ